VCPSAGRATSAGATEDWWSGCARKASSERAPRRAAMSRLLSIILLQATFSDRRSQSTLSCWLLHINAVWGTRSRTRMTYGYVVTMRVADAASKRSKVCGDSDLSVNTSILILAHQRSPQTCSATVCCRGSSRVHAESHLSQVSLPRPASRNGGVVV
jgi:hypothetical protein